MSLIFPCFFLWIFIGLDRYCFQKNCSMKYFKILIFSFFTSALTNSVNAQLPVSLNLPQVSPLESRSITIGLTKISFEYSSVGIKEREIWGDLVPFGEIWRTGANKNTVFSVSDDVLINGKLLAAGSYGFHTIPGEKEWVIIFSKNNEAWGSYFYDESEDALRITVPVSKMDSRYEWMKFSFSTYTSTSVNVSLKWAYRSIPFTVEVPMDVTLQKIKKQFTNKPAFSWQGWQQGANYLLANEYKLDTALEWAHQAVGREKNPKTLSTLARLQWKNGLKSEAMESASSLTNWLDNWRAHFWAGEIYELAEKKDEAKYAYQMAHDLAENKRIKANIKNRIDLLNE